jgi:hypothetical protein
MSRTAGTKRTAKADPVGLIPAQFTTNIIHFAPSNDTG